MLGTIQYREIIPKRTDTNPNTKPTQNLMLTMIPNNFEISYMESKHVHSLLNEAIIYSIICLKSVDVRTMQFVILAHSPREMSQTDRIHPRYFLLRVRVSIRPRYFVNAKKT